MRYDRILSCGMTPLAIQLFGNYELPSPPSPLQNYSGSGSPGCVSPVATRGPPCFMSDHYGLLATITI